MDDTEMRPWGCMLPGQLVSGLPTLGGQKPPNSVPRHTMPPTLIHLILTILIGSFASLGILSDQGDALEVTGKTVYLVRHAEKCAEPSDDPGLTEEGQMRAQELVRVMTDVAVDAIYSTPFTRTRDTVRLLATAKGIDITETPIRSGFLEALADDIRASSAQYIVVSGHSNTTPRVVNLLAGTSFDDLEETEYDRLYVVHLQEDGQASVTVLRFGAASGTQGGC